jgi:hypothetical protein
LGSLTPPPKNTLLENEREIAVCLSVVQEPIQRLLNLHMYNYVGRLGRGSFKSTKKIFLFSKCTRLLVCSVVNVYIIG